MAKKHSALLMRTYVILVFCFMYLPIAVMIAFSFNESKSRSNFTGFTLGWYKSLFHNEMILSALGLSLVLALVSSIIATVLGTLATLGINSMSRKSQLIINNISYVPVVNPEIITGVSLMLLFVMAQNFGIGGESGISITSGISEGTVTRTYTLTETGAPAGYDGAQGSLGTVTVTAETEEVLENGKFVMKTTYTADIDGQSGKEISNTKRTADDYKRIFDAISSALGGEAAETLHCHFSQIEYTKMGEKRHLTFADETFGPFFGPLAEAIVSLGVSPTIICESAGTMAEDALRMKELLYAAEQRAGRA